MAKALARYVCTSCGARLPKWLGRCADCGAWNTVAEEAQPTAGPGSAMADAEPSPVVSLRERLAEASRLGFRRAVIPEHNRRTQESSPEGLEVTGAAKVAELAAALLP